MVPEGFLHFVNIFLYQDLLPATRFVDKGVIVKGTAVIFQDLVATSVTNPISTEDILFKEGNPVCAFLEEGEIVGSLDLGFLWRFVVLIAHCNGFKMVS